MKRKSLLSGSRAAILLVLCLWSLVGFSQKKPPKNPLESFLDTQFWLGLRMGTTLTSANPATRYSGFSPLDYGPETLEKNYDDFSLTGVIVGLDMTLYHRGFSFSFIPGYRINRFEYQSGASWQGEDPSAAYSVNYAIQQRLDWFDLPVNIKFDLMRKGKLRPFVMGGGYWSILGGAQKELGIRQTDSSTGTPLSYQVSSTAIGVKDAFRSGGGVSAGGGINFDFGNVRATLEGGYRWGISAISRPEIVQNEFISLGDRNDEIKLNDLSISLSLVFPFRYLDQQFKSM